jgi:hypothetical protein
VQIADADDVMIKDVDRSYHERKGRVMTHQLLRRRDTEGRDSPDLLRRRLLSERS